MLIRPFLPRYAAASILLSSLAATGVRAQVASDSSRPALFAVQTTAVPAESPKTAVSLQAGISAATLTAEAEIRMPFGLVAGMGVHGSRFAPLGPTGRLGYDYTIPHRNWHLRAGLRLYPFAESGATWSCTCAMLVPEVGIRYVNRGGFVFEFSEPAALLNLNRVSKAGWGALSGGGQTSLLFSLLFGYAVQF